LHSEIELGFYLRPCDQFGVSHRYPDHDEGCLVFLAAGAGVPMALGFLDYRLKTGGIGSVFHPIGNLEHDLKTIHRFYRDITGKHPGQSIQVPAVSEPA